MMEHASLKQEPSLGVAWQSSTDSVTDFFSLYHYYIVSDALFGITYVTGVIPSVLFHAQ